MAQSTRIVEYQERILPDLHQKKNVCLPLNFFFLLEQARNGSWASPPPKFPLEDVELDFTRAVDKATTTTNKAVINKVVTITFF